MVDLKDPNDVERRKAIQLFSYLKELALLRTRKIISIDQDQYEEVLWLNDIPKEPGCFAAAWEPDEEPESWVQVTKPQFRSYPPPSA